MPLHSLPRPATSVRKWKKIVAKRKLHKYFKSLASEWRHLSMESSTTYMCGCSVCKTSHKLQPRHCQSSADCVLASQSQVPKKCCTASKYCAYAALQQHAAGLAHWLAGWLADRQVQWTQFADPTGKEKTQKIQIMRPVGIYGQPADV